MLVVVELELLDKLFVESGTQGLEDLARMHRKCVVSQVGWMPVFVSGARLRSRDKTAGNWQSPIPPPRERGVGRPRRESDGLSAGEGGTFCLARIGTSGQRVRAQGLDDHQVRSVYIPPFIAVSNRSFALPNFFPSASPSHS